MTTTILRYKDSYTLRHKEMEAQRSLYLTSRIFLAWVPLKILRHRFVCKTNLIMNTQQGIDRWKNELRLGKKETILRRSVLLTSANDLYFTEPSFNILCNECISENLKSTHCWGGN